MGLDLIMEEMGGALLVLLAGGATIAMLATLMNYVSGF